MARLSKLWLVCLLLTCPPLLAFKDEKAPLHPKLTTSQTLYLYNDQGDIPCFDRLYSDMKKWGRFELVGSPEEAELLGILTQHSERTFLSFNSTTVVLGSTAVSSGSGGLLNYKNFHFKIYDIESKMQIWTDTEEGWWTNKGAVSKMVRNLKERMPKKND